MTPQCPFCGGETKFVPPILRECKSCNRGWEDEHTQKLAVKYRQRPTPAQEDEMRRKEEADQEITMVCRATIPCDPEYQMVRFCKWLLNKLRV